MPWRLGYGGVTEPRPLGVTVLAASGLFCSVCLVEAHSQDHGSAQDTEWTHPLDSLRVDMSRVLQGVIQREEYVPSVNQTMDGADVAHQGEGRRRAGECAGREVDCGTGPKLLTKKTRSPDCPPKKRLLEQLPV